MRNTIRNRTMLLLTCVAAFTLGTNQASHGALPVVKNDGGTSSPEDREGARETHIGVVQGGVRRDAPPPQDQTPPRKVWVDIFRNDMTNQLTLALRGALTSRLLSRTEVLGPTLHLFVYPDAQTAERDSVCEGVGNVFFGEVALGTRVSTKGGFSKEDFTVERAEGGLIVARAFEGGTTTISVPNAATAVVRLITDPDRILRVPAEEESAGTAQPEETKEPAVTMLWDPRPNPAREGVTLRFSVSRRAPARLDIFDVQGRRVATLVNGVLEPGPRELSWDRVDLSGNRAKGGVYFVRFEAEGRRFTYRLAMLR
jgi:hypothetical protein